MEQNESRKKPETWSFWKNLFGSKEVERRESFPSSQNNLNDRHGDATTQTAGSEGQRNTITGDSQNNSRKDLDRSATEEDISVKLWNDAYEEMRNGQDESRRTLVTTYEKVLVKLASNGGASASEPSNFSILMK